MNNFYFLIFIIIFLIIFTVYIIISLLPNKVYTDGANAYIVKFQLFPFPQKRFID